MKLGFFILRDAATLRVFVNIASVSGGGFEDKKISQNLQSTVVCIGYIPNHLLKITVAASASQLLGHEYP